MLRWFGVLGLAVLIASIATCSGTVDVPSEDGDADVDTDGDTDADADADECPGGCPSGQFCRGGRCVSGCSGPTDCTAPYECCGGACVNTREDPANCGACGSTCAPEGDACIGGTCSCNGAVACAAPMSCCGSDGCVDTTSSANHCGRCGNRCDGGCADSACATCTPDAHETGGGSTCPDALPLGELADSGDQQTLTGNLFPDGDQDCFYFTAIDSEDAECDTFHVDIRLTSNPDEQFAIEVYRGSCEAPECATEPYSQYSWATDFYSTAGDEVRGECPCAPEPEEDANQCTDGSAMYRFCVVRLSGTPADCAWYEVEISNGVYTTSG